MGKNELDNSNSAKQYLIDFATKEAQLIWNRYGCMVVANSILLGFIGQLAIRKNTAPLGICACGIGLVIALLWLFLTSYAWSLSAYLVYKSDTPQQNAYEEWRKRMWNKLPKDPIWLSAHLVILVFCVAYILLTFHFSTRWCVRGGFIVWFLISIIKWLYVVNRKKWPKPPTQTNN